MSEDKNFVEAGHFVPFWVLLLVLTVLAVASFLAFRWQGKRRGGA